MKNESIKEMRKFFSELVDQRLKMDERNKQVLIDIFTEATKGKDILITNSRNPILGGRKAIEAMEESCIEKSVNPPPAPIVEGGENCKASIEKDVLGKYQLAG
jgi:hypothetical protein